MSAFLPQGAELAAAVAERELLRLLGLPRGRGITGELRERTDAARGWYSASGRPFAAARRVAVTSVSASQVRLADGTGLRSRALADGLRAASGQAVLVLAVSAGREVAAEIARLWSADRPDEAYVLDRFAAGVAEALVLRASGDECRRLAPAGETLLSPLSPGCGDFDLAHQQQLAGLLGAEPEPGERVRLGPIGVLPSGALDPPHSLLAVLGVARGALASPSPDALCRACELDPCGYRRAPVSGPSVGWPSVGRPVHPARARAARSAGVS